jgi:hypothetical protein
MLSEREIEHYRKFAIDEITYGDLAGVPAQMAKAILLLSAELERRDQHIGLLELKLQQATGSDLSSDHRESHIDG